MSLKDFKMKSLQDKLQDKQEEQEAKGVAGSQKRTRTRETKNVKKEK